MSACFCMCVFQALCMYVCMYVRFAYLLQVFDPEASLQHSVFQFYCVLARTLPKHGDDCFLRISSNAPSERLPPGALC